MAIDKYNKKEFHVDTKDCCTIPGGDLLSWDVKRVANNIGIHVV